MHHTHLSKTKVAASDLHADHSIIIKPKFDFFSLLTNKQQTDCTHT